MRTLSPLFLAVALATTSVGPCSCAISDPLKKLVKPVTGTILVDGMPEAGVEIFAIQTTHITDYTTSVGVTDAKGRFEFGTYDPADGIPPGEYKLTFYWPAVNGDDRLNGRYSTVAKSTTTTSVKEGGVDLGTILLTTK